MKKGQQDLHRENITRLRRVEGQVRGVIGMIEDGRYCLDILTQMKAVKAAISKIEASIIEKHLDHCVHTAVSSNDKEARSEVIEEIRKLLRSK